ncbi:MAG: hypothetical protein LDL13_04470 [Calditerrivibrio sp.]|nr:hypothetical protein [Calditerrivibrio sp.]MCA1932811.1 hypothetical protein [Calditerrivibrio sp.]MCA1980229.1 hypothetical protein [Calditerrivibrio sp.]
MFHPFSPIIEKNTTKLIIGTLPPEKSGFYYSNNSNNRLWDFLKGIYEKSEEIPTKSLKLSIEDKLSIIRELKIGFTDIILEYERENNSTLDSDIIPLRYRDIDTLILNSEITELYFVYKNAAKWFLHSRKNLQPVKISKLNHFKIPDEKIFYSYELNGRIINAKVLPTPLNRFTKKGGLREKYNIYKKYLGDNP